MDLKENNILIDDNTENPIIIDFGLSYDITDLQLSNFRELFFVYGYDYPPWCFDISVISFLVNDLGDDWENQYITKDILTKLCENFIEKNPLFILKEDENYLFKPTEIEEFKTKLLNYTLSNFVEKKAKDVVLALYSYNKTWDFYAICVMFYFSFCILHLDDLNSLYPKFELFISHIKSVILSLPNERIHIEDSSAIVSNIFDKAHIDEIKNVSEIIRKNGETPQKMDVLKKNVEKSKLENLENQKIILK